MTNAVSMAKRVKGVYDFRKVKKVTFQESNTI